MFYPTMGRLPFVEMVKTEKIKLNMEIHKDKFSLLMTLPDAKTICNFDTNGVLLERISFFRFFPDRPMIPTSSWSIKKIKNFSGFNFPIVLEGEINMVHNETITQKIKRRIVVREDTLKVNQDFHDAEFAVQIPVGARVSDERRGIHYEADGFSGDFEKTLKDTLEEFVKEAGK
jgi:hypothetical protein